MKNLKDLNHPAFVSVGGLVAFGVSQVLEGWLTADCSLQFVKLLNWSAYGLSVFAVGRPGRIDGLEEVSKLEKNEKDEIKDDENHPSIQSYLSGRSILTPSGWAFIIWGPIFLGEFVFVSSSTAMVKESSPVTPLFKKVSAHFIMAHVFQTLWTASFRPKYTGKSAFISASMLSGIAYSLSRAHAHFSSSTSQLTGVEYALYFLPLTLHFGWTTAASLVNWNGATSVQPSTTKTTVTGLGHLSAVLATSLGVAVTVVREAPVFGGTIAWALAACATGMNKRIRSPDDESAEKDVGKNPSLLAERAQLWLCASGALVSMAASIFVTLRPSKT